MNDTGTRALERIADALELQALIARLNRVEEVLSDFGDTENDAYTATLRLARQLAYRVDQLIGWEGEEE